MGPSYPALGPVARTARTVGRRSSWRRGYAGTWKTLTYGVTGYPLGNVYQIMEHHDFLLEIYRKNVGKA